jgi:group I intron endonuclease
MTTGIYKLSFNGTDKVYVGKSINIEARFTDHIRVMSYGKEPKKLQTAYNTYGIPTLHLLLVCSKEELDYHETNLITKLNAVTNGFNTLSTSGEMPCFYGEDHPLSAYSNKQIEEAFILLVKSDLTHQQIADTTGVSKPIVNHIARGSCHTWLKDVYPKEFETLMNSVKRGVTSADRGIILPQVKSPEGEIYTITNIRAFSRDHNIPYSTLNSLLKGRCKHARNWVTI